MKIILPLLVLIAFALSGCKERELSIPELSVGARHVLIEELTGVRCTNCPDGARLLEDLQDTYGKENLIVVSIHSAQGFNDPYTGNHVSQYDFFTEKGKALADYIGPFEGAPCASIARFLPLNGTSPFLLPPAEWPGFIASEFGKDFSLGLFVSNDYDPVTRKLDVLVNIAPEVTITDDVRLTVVITQDSIVDPQSDNGVIKDNYVHRHVFRDVITAPSGDAISTPLSGGSLISKSFSLQIPAEWVAKHCSVVAYVHRTTANDKLVLQAAEAHVIE